jgi:hypothetical protein
MNPKVKKVLDQKLDEAVYGLKLIGELLVTDEGKVLDRLEEEHRRSLPKPPAPVASVPARVAPPQGPQRVILDAEIIEEEPARGGRR